ncbi:MAG: glycoside hydrolase family 15 protein [Thermoplasmata archaeon]
MKGSRRHRRDPSPPAPAGLTPSIHDYAVIGNLHTAALVSRAGSIDWACLPRFASPSVFARLLDPEAGHFTLAPISGPRGTHRYRPGTNVLDTIFDLEEGGQLVLTDFMPTGPAPDPEGRAIIVRRVEAIGASVRVRGELAPRFHYGRVRPVWGRTARGPTARGGDERLAIKWVGDPVLEQGVLRGEWDVAPGRPIYFSVAWGEHAPASMAGPANLERTIKYWTRWVHSEDSPLHALAAHWHDEVTRTELALKLLSQSDTGAFVAAPTTSLPEWPGGPRNWDYRYVWIRDAAFSAAAFLALGHLAEARSFLEWVLNRLAAPDGYPLRVVYGAHGATDLRERSLRHLAGFRDSRPVRVGNAASTQWQLDIFGELFDSARVLARLDPSVIDRAWPLLAPVADALIEGWRRPDRGIWELRARPAHHVHSKVMAWVALDRATVLAELAHDPDRASRYRASAGEVRAAVLDRGIDPKSGSFVAAFGSTEADAANLRIPQVGFLPFDDPRVLATLRRVEAELSVGAFVRRYAHADGLEGPEGTFLPCAFWRVEAVARSGERARARRLLRTLVRAASPTGLFSEEYDPASATPLGNYPQAFTHVAFLRAVLAVEAPQRAAESIARVPGRPDRPVRSVRGSAQGRRRRAVDP